MCTCFWWWGQQKKLSKKMNGGRCCIGIVLVGGWRGYEYKLFECSADNQSIIFSRKLYFVKIEVGITNNNMKNCIRVDMLYPKPLPKHRENTWWILIWNRVSQNPHYIYLYKTGSLIHVRMIFYSIQSNHILNPPANFSHCFVYKGLYTALHNIEHIFGLKS